MGATSTWTDRELPILEIIADVETEFGDRPSSDELVEALFDLEPESVLVAVEALVEAGYLTGVNDSTPADRHTRYEQLRLLERGRRVVGQWPPDAGEAFLATLNRLIESEPDPVKRRVLVKLADSARGVATGVLSGLVVAASQAQLGG